MCRIIVLLTFILCWADIAAQEKVRPLFRSKSHLRSVVIPGTRIGVEAPENFRISQRFSGLEGENSLIEFYDLPGGNFNDISRDFAREKFIGQGFTIHSQNDVTVDGRPGMIFSMQKDYAEKVMSLVFGDQLFSVIAVAHYQSSDVLLENELRQCLMSIKYTSSDVSNPLDRAAFKLDDSRAAYQFQKYFCNTFYYAPPGAQGTSADSYLTVTQLAWDYTTSPAVIGELMRKEMNKYGLQNAVVRKESMKKFHGDYAYESHIAAVRSGKECEIYQMVVVHDGRAVVIHGIDKGTGRKAKESFRKLAHTLKFKEN